jgi:hypothetical protein
MGNSTVYGVLVAVALVVAAGLGYAFLVSAPQPREARAIATVQLADHVTPDAGQSVSSMRQPEGTAPRNEESGKAAAEAMRKTMAGEPLTAQERSAIRHAAGAEPHTEDERKEFEDAREVLLALVRKGEADEDQRRMLKVVCMRLSDPLCDSEATSNSARSESPR